MSGSQATNSVSVANFLVVALFRSGAGGNQPPRGGQLRPSGRVAQFNVGQAISLPAFLFCQSQISHFRLLLHVNFFAAYKDCMWRTHSCVPRRDSFPTPGLTYPNLFDCGSAGGAGRIRDEARAKALSALPTYPTNLQLSTL
jgi:hypothetical protein